MRRYYPLLVILMLLVTAPASAAAHRQTVNTVPLSGPVSLVQQAIDTELPDFSQYAITDIYQDGDNYIYSVAGLTASGDYNVERDGAWFGTIHTNGETYTVNPEEALTTFGDYWFPWEFGKQTFFGPLGVHTCSSDTWAAVDFVSGTALGDQAASNDVYAAANGEVTYICRSDYSMNVHTSALRYFHLVDDTGLTISDTLTQGEAFANLVFGPFDDDCGYAEQQPTNYHLHLCFPDPSSGYFYMENWKLSVDTDTWYRGSDTVATLEWMLAEWEGEGGGESYDYENFFDLLISGFELIVNSVQSMLPTHQSIQLAVLVYTYASIPIEYLYTMALLKFGFVFFIVAIIAFLEVVRLIYAAWMFVKRAIPVIG